jgi:CheY-like chemotaxis protein
VGLILCDLLLPDIDGFTVIAALHEDPATRRVPVLALTSGELSDTDKSRLNGKIAGVLQKGDEVPAALQQWLNAAARSTAAAGRSSGGPR